MTPEPYPSVPRADTLQWCSTEPPSVDLAPCDAEMAARGARRLRTLVQLRRKLPLDAASRIGIPEIVVRPFEADRDAEGLLAVNNAAFSWHPEQGAWDMVRLRDALAQPWVDTAGILVHESEDPRGGSAGIDGFCWTRMHPADDPEVLRAGDPPLGEIWVIATHPRVHGTRLGPALVASGLDHLAHQGLRTANLYTEEQNHAAVAMYDRMGFGLHQRRGGYG